MEDIQYQRFGNLIALMPLYSEERRSDNTVWLCACDCGKPNCEKYVRRRRGQLTRKDHSKYNQSCNCGSITPSVVADKGQRTRLVCGTIQKNNTSGITGVKFQNNKYTAFIGAKGKTITCSGNFTKEQATKIRKVMESIKKIYERA